MMMLTYSLLYTLNFCLSTLILLLINIFKIMLFVIYMICTYIQNDEVDHVIHPYTVFSGNAVSVMATEGLMNFGTCRMYRTKLSSSHWPSKY